jgi:phosphoserine phosphatase
VFGVRYGTVVFDCDSTLCAVEGIEELAGAARAEVAELTEAAMRGEVPLEEVYGRRLELIRPPRQRVLYLADRYVATLVPDAREVVAALLRAGVEVRIMSGGLLPPVQLVAEALGLAASAVHAVDVYFDEEGEYAGYDEASPLARSDGKRVLLEALRAELPGPVLLVGDGATDMEAKPAVHAFVAYAGVLERPVVTAAADFVVRSLSLAPVLPLALGGEPPGNPEDRALHLRGMQLLEEGGGPPGVGAAARRR